MLRNIYRENYQYTILKYRERMLNAVHEDKTVSRATVVYTASMK